MAQSALIQITVDPSKSIITINGVTMALNQLEKAQKRVNEEIEDNTEIVKNSLKWHKMQVQQLDAVREATSTSSDEYDKATVEIKKHNMAIAEIVQNKELERAAVKGSFQDYENQIMVLRRQQKMFADNNEAVLQYEKRIQSLRAEQRALTTGTRLTGKGMASMSTSAGLAGAAATEFGRMVGDAQYGIQGVSNNIQQLGALFTDLVQQEGSARKAFDLFKSTLVGPAGVLVAISLVTTAIELFVRSQKKAEDAVKNFNESIFLETGALTILAKKYKDQESTDENRLQMLYQLALANEKVRNIIQDETLTLDQRIAKGEQFIDNQLALNAAREELAKITATLEGVEADAIPTIEEYNAAKLKQAEAVKTVTSFGTMEARVYDESKAKELEKAERVIAIYEAQENQAEVSAKVIGYQDILNELTEDSSKKKKEEAAIVKNSIRDYEKRIETIQKEMKNVDLNSEAYEKLDKQLASLNATYQELLLTQRLLDIEAAEKAIEAADIRIEAAMDSVKTEQESFAKRKELTMREQGLGDDYLSWSIGFYKRLSEDEAFSDEERLRFRELYVAAVEKIRTKEKKAADEADKTAKAEAKRKEEEAKKTLENIKNITSTINDFIAAEAQREIDIETNRTNALNEQLRERLRNEELSKEERDRINQEIARNEAALVDKENAINKKRFEQQKAFNIAMAIIDTYVAANMALKDETLVNTFARIAAMVSIIGSGLANVATISRQEFVGRVASTPTLRGTTGSSGGDRVFNVVGASQQTQIAEAIANIEDRPVKAYVVSSDVSTAQELDRKVIEGASI